MILIVKLDHFPKIEIKKYVENHQLDKALIVAIQGQAAKPMGFTKTLLRIRRSPKKQHLESCHVFLGSFPTD